MIRDVLIWVISIICFASCTNNGNDVSGKKIFKYNQADNINSLDPAFAKSQNNMWAVHQIFDGLLALNDSMAIIPRIAKSWEIQEDGKTIHFNLDQRYRFHNNKCFGEQGSRSVTAQDVVYSFSRIISDQVNSPGSWIFLDIVDEKRPFVAENDSTFVLRLKKPFQPILGILTMQYCSIIPKEAVDYYGKNFRNNPVGTGPFRMKRWQENHALYLGKNDHYPDIQHNLDAIKISFIPDKKIAFFEFLNGKLDFFSGIESSFGPEMLDREGKLRSDRSDHFAMYSNPYLNLEYIGINMELAKNSPLANRKFRQALNYAINKEELLALLKSNIGEPANHGVIPPGLKGHSPDLPGYPFNLSLAQEQLAELNFNGEIEPLKISTNADYLDVITYVAKSWENLGINVEIDLLESAVLRQQMRNGEIELFRASWIADYPDEESYLCLFYGSNPAPPNYTRFSNERYDELYEKSIVMAADKPRRNMYRQMDSIVCAHVPLVPLYYDETALFTSKAIVRGISANSLNLLDTRHIIMN